MSANHTPGPWLALGLLSPFGWVIKHNDKDGNESIAYIQAYDIEDDDPEPYGKWSDENKANHDVVLAAPDLLTWLKWSLGQLPASEHETWQYEQARAAIAKATGASS